MTSFILIHLKSNDRSKMSKRIEKITERTDHREEGVHPLSVYINALRDAEAEREQMMQSMFEQIDMVFEKIKDIGAKAMSAEE